MVEPAGNDLFHHARIVLGIFPDDLEFPPHILIGGPDAVVFFPGGHGADRFFAGEMRIVIAFRSFSGKKKREFGSYFFFDFRHPTFDVFKVWLVLPDLFKDQKVVRILEGSDEFFILAGEDAPDLGDGAFVGAYLFRGRRRRFIAAVAGAVADLRIETYAEMRFAGTVRERAPENAEHDLDRISVGERPDVFGAGIDELMNDPDTREAFFRDRNVEIILVVPKEDIVFRLKRLNEPGFDDKRFDIRLERYDLQCVRFRMERFCFQIRDGEIILQAIAEI